MFRSRITVIGVIIVIWALVFCIPYLIPRWRTSLNIDTKSSKVVLEEKDNEAKSKLENEDRQQGSEKENEKQGEQTKTEEKEADDDDMHKDAVIKGEPTDVQKEIENDEPKFKGEVKQGEMCLDTLEHKQGERVGLFKCHGLGRNQYWFFTKKNLLKNNNVCIQGPSKRDGINFVLLQECDVKVEEQRWEYESESLILSGTKFCLDSEDATGLSVRKCDRSSNTQKWKING